MDSRMAENGAKKTDYEYVIVGSGLAGSVLARRLAEKSSKHVLVLERRIHIGGNIYDYIDSHGIRVQKYGPHVFHSNLDSVYRFIQSYTKIVPYRTRCEAILDGVNTPSPFNFRTIDQFYPLKEGEKLKLHLRTYYPNREEVTILEMLNATDPNIVKYAKFLFEKDYRPYTAKQWGLQPSEIDPSVLKRVPVVLSYRDTYFEDIYEFLPQDGFTDFVRNLLNHPNITVQLNTDALNRIIVDEDSAQILYEGKKPVLIYTGAIDELFNYRFGILPYRSLQFRMKSYQTESYQNSAIVVYPQAEGYTRITEYTKMPVQDGYGWTSIAEEYPVKYDKKNIVGNEPYYPVLTEESTFMYKKYSEYARKFRNLILCGRLAEFKYYNMDQVILRALEVFKMLEEKEYAAV